MRLLLLFVVCVLFVFLFVFVGGLCFFVFCFQIHVSRFKLQDSSCKIQDSSCKIQVANCKFQVFREGEADGGCTEVIHKQITTKNKNTKSQ